MKTLLFLLINKGIKPKVAILREQGINGQFEMAAAFDRAGFDSVDVHMSDLVAGRHQLSTFHTLVACGGFSFGDVLGAGNGWASSIIYNSKLKEQFQVFFEREDVLALGVCNGCQMMSQLKEIIPGAELWPRFVRNTSEQFEARLVNVKINQDTIVAFYRYAGLYIASCSSPWRRARVEASAEQLEAISSASLSVINYINYDKQITELYPLNPNGSPLGITGLTNSDGRFTIMMPHPERLFRTSQFSWHPDEWGEDSPWMRMFRNARVALG